MQKMITIVIPFHNEEPSLRELVPSLLEVTQRFGKATFEILFVDDVSEDNSTEVIKNFQLQHSVVKLIQLTSRGGQTGCFQVAFRQAHGDYILRMDADLQDDPRDLPKFLEKINEGAELIVGLRECRKHSRVLRLASGIYDLIILALLDSPLHSNSGSYVCFKANLVKNIPFKKNDHRFLPLIAIHRGARNIAEVFVRHNERQYGRSNYNTLKKLFVGVVEVLLFLIRMKRGYYKLA